MNSIINKIRYHNSNRYNQTIILLAVFLFFCLSILNFSPSYIYAEGRIPFITPLQGEIIVCFKQAYLDKEKKVTRRHTGLDIAGSSGDYIIASGTGIVSYIGFSPIGGRTVVIRHNKKIRTTYLNLLSIYVTEGSFIKQGERIGTIGAHDDPSSDKTHLHFGVIYNEKYLDPEDVLNIDYSSISKFISLEYIESDFRLINNS